MAKNVTVVGAGSWGTALAQVLCDNQNNVKLYDLNQEIVDDINQNHRNSRFFADVQLPVGLVEISYRGNLVVKTLPVLAAAN